MDARELTKKMHEAEDRLFKLENENRYLKQVIYKLQLEVGDHICKNLVDQELLK